MEEEDLTPTNLLDSYYCDDPYMDALCPISRRGSKSASRARKNRIKNGTGGGPNSIK